LGASMTQHVLYGAWGNVEAVSGDSLPQTRLGWKGLVWEGGTAQLYYVRSRWYDPQSRSFLSEDPLGLAGGRNTYAYADNDPVNGWDPSGMSMGIDCDGVQIDWYDVQIDASSGAVLNEVYLGSTCVGGGGGRARGGGSGGRGQSKSAAKTTTRACPAQPASARPDASVADNVLKMLNLRQQYGIPFAAGYWLFEVGKGAWKYKDNPANQNLGNFNYGATGVAAGVNGTIVKWGAGLVQTYRGDAGNNPGSADPSILWGVGGPLVPFTVIPPVSPYGDEPFDQQEIEQGIRFATNGCFISAERAHGGGSSW